MSESTPQSPVTKADQQAAQSNEQPRGVNPQELIAVLQAAAALRENRSKSIRTKELDFEAEQAKSVVNSFLSRNAFDALHAMEFMYMIAPSQVAQLAQVFASHRYTYMPMVQTLNDIAKARQEAATKAKEATDAETA